MSRKEFFAWCDARGLTKSQDISESFRVSSQTIRNWLRKKPEDAMPAWVSLACVALSEAFAGETTPKVPPMTVTKLSTWQRKHGFKTYEDTANVFSIKRQAVHNWHKRGRFPKWLSLACIGYDSWIQTAVAKDSSVAA